MAPRFKIDAHVFYYSVALIGCTGTAYIAATVFGKTEEEKIKELVIPTKFSFLDVTFLTFL